MQQPSFENAHGLCCPVFGIRKGTDREWILVLLYHEHIEVLRVFLLALLGLDCSSDMVYLEWSPIVSCPSPLPSGSLLNSFGLKLLRTLGPLGSCLLEHPWIHSRRLYSSPLERSQAPQKILVNSSAKRPSPSSRGERVRTKG